MERGTDCRDLPAVIKTPYVADVPMCEACSPHNGRLRDPKDACPAAKDLYYGAEASDQGSNHLRCELITALVGGNIKRALKLCDQVDAHHGKNLRCDPLKGARAIERYLSRI